MAKAEVDFSVLSAEFDDWRKSVATPLTSTELRQREKETEELLSGTWERFRDYWFCGIIPFDAVTTIPCMRFTDADLDHPYYAHRCEPSDTLQIVSVQLRSFNASLPSQLDVYGFIAIHDVLDRKRIMVFNRERKDCQTINKQDSYLRLTGPTRGVLVSIDPSYLEVVLKAKGVTESEDKDLSKFARTVRVGCRYPIEYTSKLCTLEMQHYTVYSSVEATVSVKLFQGQWPLCFRGVLNASTAGKNDIKIALLHLNDDELPVDDDGFIKLSRRVVCVEHGGKLGVSLFENGAGEEGDVWFAAEKSRRTTHYMHVKKYSLCLQIIIAWSVCSRK
ncbi:uncharacterized protein LOC124667908 [Lolium rigidum]|uniref:uncharacterized protein LOC124667908 n=1 Tax=Lolium rigidum TaxID=89674 RepID=UPI001F5DE6E9|nr:uncharacterized protein LOC124667908 [Lolium rigidum]